MPARPVPRTTLLTLLWPARPRRDAGGRSVPPGRPPATTRRHGVTYEQAGALERVVGRTEE
jgi:hypothetical protein